MCEMCRKDEGYCEDCGKCICWDVESADDVLAPAAVTSDGQTVCARCASRYELEEMEVGDE